MKTYTIYWSYSFGGAYEVQANSREEATDLFDEVPISELIDNMNTGYMDIDQVLEEGE